MKIIGKLICYFRGHRRGKRISSGYKKYAKFQCTRCSATWERNPGEIRSKPEDAA